MNPTSKSDRPPTSSAQDVGAPGFAFAQPTQTGPLDFWFGEVAPPWSPAINADVPQDTLPVLQSASFAWPSGPSGPSGWCTAIATSDQASMVPLAQTAVTMDLDTGDAMELDGYIFPDEFPSSATSFGTFPSAAVAGWSGDVDSFSNLNFGHYSQVDVPTAADAGWLADADSLSNVSIRPDNNLDIPMPMAQIENFHGFGFLNEDAAPAQVSRSGIVNFQAVHQPLPLTSPQALIFRNRICTKAQFIEIVTAGSYFLGNGLLYELTFGAQSGPGSFWLAMMTSSEGGTLAIKGCPHNVTCDIDLATIQDVLGGALKANLPSLRSMGLRVTCYPLFRPLLPSSQGSPPQLPPTNLLKSVCSPPAAWITGWMFGPIQDEQRPLSAAQSPSLVDLTRGATSTRFIAWLASRYLELKLFDHLQKHINSKEKRSTEQKRVEIELMMVLECSQSPRPVFSRDGGRLSQLEDDFRDRQQRIQAALWVYCSIKITQLLPFDDFWSKCVRFRPGLAWKDLALRFQNNLDMLEQKQRPSAADRFQNVFKVPGKERDNILRGIKAEIIYSCNEGPSTDFEYWFRMLASTQLKELVGAVSSHKSPKQKNTDTPYNPRAYSSRLFHALSNMCWTADDTEFLIDSGNRFELRYIYLKYILRQVNCRRESLETYHTLSGKLILDDFVMRSSEEGIYWDSAYTCSDLKNDYSSNMDNHPSRRIADDSSTDMDNDSSSDMDNDSSSDMDSDSSSDMVNDISSNPDKYKYEFRICASSFCLGARWSRLVDMCGDSIILCGSPWVDHFLPWDISTVIERGTDSEFESLISALEPQAGWLRNLCHQMNDFVDIISTLSQFYADKSKFTVKTSGCPLIFELPLGGFQVD
ncbi:hypothetical protein NLG97_g3416 [Lecanicillium saksenae]|uniref:Uncharacterized protein n=1 Tax=Lecanicillium saksenae TaxID=468837 RepID=A0ACC1R0U1_9HYPO|nr:hypothetical protein NLG97_g3416 [Lecanicillium saksenae]